jgi:hypothetical protein
MDTSNKERELAFQAIKESIESIGITDPEEISQFACEVCAKTVAILVNDFNNPSTSNNKKAEIVACYASLEVHYQKWVPTATSLTDDIISRTNLPLNQVRELANCSKDLIDKENQNVLSE